MGFPLMLGRLLFADFKIIFLSLILESSIISLGEDYLGLKFEQIYKLNELEYPIFPQI